MNATTSTVTTPTAHKTEKHAARLLIYSSSLPERLQLSQSLNASYRLVSAESLTAVRFALEKRAFDIALVDMASPSSMNVLRLISHYARKEYLPVIVLTDGEVVNKSVFDLGVDDCLTKPLDLAKVEQRISVYMKMKQRLEAKEATIERMANVQEEQRRLVYMMTHDLRHPLANLRMAQAVMQRYEVSQQDATNILNGMISSLTSMEEVLDDFYSAYLLEDEANASKLNIHLAFVSVPDVIYNVVEQYRVAADRKDIAVLVQSAEGDIIADRKRMIQVLSNLLSNAIKFSPIGSTIRIKTARIGDALRISVCDEGPGIPSEERHKLFTEFGRLSNRPTADETSTGLGLWIVKRLTEAMKGRVDVDTAADQGATFWVEYPTVPRQERKPIVSIPMIGEDNDTLVGVRI